MIADSENRISWHLGVAAMAFFGRQSKPGLSRIYGSKFWCVRTANPFSFSPLHSSIFAWDGIKMHCGAIPGYCWLCFILQVLPFLPWQVNQKPFVQFQGVRLSCPWLLASFQLDDKVCISLTSVNKQVYELNTSSLVFLSFCGRRMSVCPKTLLEDYNILTINRTNKCHKV